jgi:hypothetical protein
MFTFHQVNAMQEYRYPKADGRREPGVRRSHTPLPRLLAAMAGSLARLGVRERHGKTRPASPAY